MCTVECAVECAVAVAAELEADATTAKNSFSVLTRNISGARPTRLRTEELILGPCQNPSDQILPAPSVLRWTAYTYHRYCSPVWLLHCGNQFLTIYHQPHSLLIKNHGLNLEVAKKITSRVKICSDGLIYQYLD